MLSRGACRLFRLIQSFVARYKRPFFAKQAWVAKHLQCSIRSVKRWYKELIDAGMILQRRRSQKAAEIIILRANLAPQMAPQMAPHYKEEPSVRLERKGPQMEIDPKRQTQNWEPDDIDPEELQRFIAEHQAKQPQEPPDGPYSRSASAA